MSSVAQRFVSGHGFSRAEYVAVNLWASAPEGSTDLIHAHPEQNSDEQLYRELWVSLASLLRSYSAVHGLNREVQADVDANEHRILARAGDKWLALERVGSAIRLQRDDGKDWTAELTGNGRIMFGEEWEEMDMAAESWARELMR